MPIPRELQVLTGIVVVLVGGALGRVSAQQSQASGAHPTTSLPQTTSRFKSTAPRLARGKYLVEGPAHCFDCHSEVEATSRPLRVVDGKKGAGRVNPVNTVTGVQAIAPNITPDPETGAGRWTDEQFERAIRRGIGIDGRTLAPNMPYAFFNAMTDEDVASVVVYLRSIPAVRNKLPQMKMTPEVAAVTAPLPLAGQPGPARLTNPLPTPRFLLARERSPRRPAAAQRGAYLVAIALCVGCHSPSRAGATPATPRTRIAGMEFSGGGNFNPRIKPQDAPATYRIASSNLTPDPSGIPYYDESVFIKTIRTGAVNGVRQLDTVMPWSWFRNMTDSDLKDIFAFLQGLTPVVHQVDNREPPTLCPIDGQMHGLGDHNVAPAKSQAVR
jgi:mono/diheme cytochrome c family protein